MSYSPEQRAMIALARRLSRGYSPRVRQALLEAEGVESHFQNLNYGDRDSKGVLQQRPSQGWGPAGNPAQDVEQFLARAAKLDRGFRGSAGQLAQAVQHSAFPGRYDQHASEARSLLGGPAGSGGGTAAAPLPGDSPADPRQEFARALITAIGHHDPHASLKALQTFKSAQDTSPAGGGGAAGAGASGGFQAGAGGGGLKELIYDPLGSIFDGHASSKPYGGHTDHVHVADANLQQQLAIIRHAQAVGLHVGENPLTDKVDPVHADHSWHYRTFKRMVGGHRVGMAEDVSGSPQQMAAFFRWVAAHYG